MANKTQEKSGKENFGYSPNRNERGYQTDKSGTSTEKRPPAETPNGGTSGKKEG